jgi:hypothetical protein
MRFSNLPPFTYEGWRNHLIEASNESVRFAREHMPLLGGAGIACLIGYYFIWIALYPNDFESFAVRCIGAVICLPACFCEGFRAVCASGYQSTGRSD